MKTKSCEIREWGKELFTLRAARMFAVAFIAMAIANYKSLAVVGTISDSTGAALPHIKVELYEDVFGFDILLDSGFTTAAGTYVLNFAGAPKNVYVQAKWHFALLPTGFYAPHVMILEDKVVAGIGNDISYSEKSTGTVLVDPTAAPVTLNLSMDEDLPNLPRLRDAINLSLDYYRVNKGTVPWVMNYDVPVHVDATTQGSFSDGTSITLGEVDITGTTVGSLVGFTSDIFHEMGHLVHYRFNGNSFPSQGLEGLFTSSSHSNDSEKNPGFAMTEGWASYTGELTDSDAGNFLGADGKYSVYRDPGNNTWRGNEASPTGKDDGLFGGFESGEDVEGALGGVWFAIHNDGSLNGFESNFRTMVGHQPDGIFDFLVGFVADEGGAGSAGALRIYEHLQTHGMVYSRARFTSDPIEADEPPDDGPPSAGNQKEITIAGSTYLFLRGTVDANFEAVSDSDLGVDDSIDLDEVKVGYKSANNGLADGPAFVAFTPPAAFSAGKVSVDTKTFGADGDYDLIVAGKNTDGYTDMFFPTWVGDGNTDVNTDEKYFKILGTWYDKDRDHSTNTDEEGKVVVDNTAPIVSGFKPQ